MESFQWFKILRGVLNRGWEENIRINLRDDSSWIDSLQYRDYGRVLLYVASNSGLDKTFIYSSTLVY